MEASPVPIKHFPVAIPSIKGGLSTHAPVFQLKEPLDFAADVLLHLCIFSFPLVLLTGGISFRIAVGEPISSMHIGVEHSPHKGSESYIIPTRFTEGQPY